MMMTASPIIKILWPGWPNLVSLKRFHFPNNLKSLEIFSWVRYLRDFQKINILNLLWFPLKVIGKDILPQLRATRSIGHFFGKCFENFALKASCSHFCHTAIHADNMAACKIAAKEFCTPRHNSAAMSLQEIETPM